MLQALLIKWAGGCYIDIFESGSRAKGTAISLASDIDYMVSLSNNCNANNGGMKGIYDSLFATLRASYPTARKQNVSIRIKIGGLEVDITPARKQLGNTNDHNLYVSKLGTWKQTNIQKHINDVSKSGRKNEIMLLKIWRELNGLEFPSVYVEYLITDYILLGKPLGLDSLASNFLHVLKELSKDVVNPLDRQIVDPASSTNILSDLLTPAEKVAIKSAAKRSTKETTWAKIIW
jgi:hypothetical protein